MTQAYFILGTRWKKKVQQRRRRVLNDLVVGMRSDLVLFVLAGSGVGVDWVDHRVAVVDASAPYNDSQAQGDWKRRK